MSSPVGSLNSTSDLLPATRTRRALEDFRQSGQMPSGSSSAPSERLEASTCKRHVVADPDAPNAPTCSGRRYVVADPDAPDAPTCQPKRYVVAPDPQTPSQRMTATTWAKQLGADLAKKMG